MKGGVGKTTCAVNLSYLAAQDGFQTLLCDLDPQGAASFYLRVKAPKKFKAKNLVKGDERFISAIKATNYDRLDILPADFSFRNIATVLHEKKHPTERLDGALHEVEDEYDLVILDAPASLDLEAENIFAAADIILLPIIPSTLSINTYKTITKFFQKNDLSLSKLWVFFSLVDRRKKLHVETIENLRQKQSNVLFTVIPYSSSIEKMGVSREPVPLRSSKTKAALAFIDLWEELKYKIPLALREKEKHEAEPLQYIS
jgi:cellulose biosynthesis protein BcsQ